jgi:hypothetical protein
VLSKLPLLPAIERGATHIVAINVTNVAGHADTARGMVSIAGYALSLGIEGMTQREVDLARRAGVELRLLDLNAPADVAFWDFAHADRLIAAGRKAAQAWLDESPLQFRSAWRTAVRVRLAWIGGRMERMAGHRLHTDTTGFTSSDCLLPGGARRHGVPGGAHGY